MTILAPSPAAEKPSDKARRLLQADEAQLRQFLKVVFRRCAGATGHVALRAFEHEGDGRAVVNAWAPFDAALPTVAARIATAVANRAFEARAVFSPPVCLFGDATRPDGARSAAAMNVVCAPAIVVELDERPSESLAKLESTIGPATLVVASGGLWQGEDKLHAYWRLGEPATTPERTASLKHARKLAAILVGADVTAVSLAHPMRWPGSWHTKAEPRLCRIISDDADRDVELSWAVEELERAVTEAGLAFGGAAARERADRRGFKTSREWTAQELDKAADAIPNDDLQWSDWNTVAMTFYDASHGSADGLEALLKWSGKSPKFDEDQTESRWRHFSSSPPTDVSGEKLSYLMRQHGPSVAELYFDAEAAQASEKGPLFPDSPPLAEKPSKTFVFEDFDALVSVAISRQTRPIIKGLLDRGAMSVLYGESNSGKTFVALDMAFHIAMGRPWNGMRTPEARVVYIAAEGGQGYAKRVAALHQRYGSPSVGRFHALRSAVDLLRPDADLVPLVEAIRAIGVDPAFVVLDTLSRAMAGGDENASTDMGALVRNLDALRGALACHLMAVHHTGKVRSKGARGHSLLRAATDTEIEIADGNIFVTKQRDIERNATASFVLDPVVLGTDPDGDLVTSAVVRLLPPEVDLPAPTPKGSQKDAEQRQRIAQAAYHALGGASSANVGEKHRQLITEMAAVKVKVGTSRPTVRDKIAWALATGVLIDVDGQCVRMLAEKNGSGATAPWTIKAFRVPGDAQPDAISVEETGDDAEDDQLERARTPTVFD